jgi:hypothetical protein
MATVNLGRIKPVFRGAYSGSTAYVVDDIVTHSDETYICIQAHGAGTQAVTQTAYWSKLAAKGADGTNVATTLTTQGDILYRDGSGLQRLGAGTSGQFLKTQGTGANPVWGDVSAGLSPSAFYNLNSDTSNKNSQTWYTIGGSSIPATEIYDTDNACTNGVFTVPSGKAGTYLVNIFSSHTGGSNHGSSDGTLHRLQVSTDSGSSWTVTPTNGEYKTKFLHSPGAEMAGAFSTHIAYNLSASHQLRAQVWSYKGGSTDVVWRAGDTNGGGAGSTAGTYFQLMKIF